MTTRLMHCGRQRSKHGGPPCQKHDTNSPCFSLRGPCLSTPMYPTTFLDRKEVLQPRELAPSPLKPSFHRGVPMHNTTRGTSVMKTTYGSLSAIRIGAINLPFRASEVGLDHTRSAHPLSLLYMSN